MSTLRHTARRIQLAIIRFWRRDARTRARAEAAQKDDVVGPTFVYQIIRRRSRGSEIDPSTHRKA